MSTTQTTQKISGSETTQTSKQSGKQAERAIGKHTGTIRSKRQPDRKREKDARADTQRKRGKKTDIQIEKERGRNIYKNKQTEKNREKET